MDKTCKQNSKKFGISVNEMIVEVGEAEESLNDLVLDDLDFVWSHGEALRR